ncbi:MAG: pyruvate kinase [Bacillota bacterium]
MKHTKIVCTIGPASADKKTLRQMMEQGMDLARLNLSHGTHELHAANIKLIRETALEMRKPVGIILDIQGPKIRTGDLPQPLKLEAGDRIILSSARNDKDAVFVDYAGLPVSVKPGSRIYLCDGMIELTVDDVKGERVYCRAVNGGELGCRKGVALPGTVINLPALTDKDRADIIFGVEHEADYIAASFVRRRRHVDAIKEIISGRNGSQMVIAKIETNEGVENLEEIMQAADACMVARGDLGIDIPVAEVPLAQQKIIRQCNRSGKPVITATEMLESMVRNPRPTRAEVTDVANAISEGTDALMLSAETATGKYPVEAVRNMAEIAERIEASLHYEDILRSKQIAASRSVEEAISHATCQTALDLGAKAIITSTQSGSTAKMVSKYRPQAPIIATTPNPRVANQLCLVWGVFPLCVPSTHTIDEMLDVSINAALEHGFIHKGDLAVITAGVRTFTPGSTNLLKVHRI